MAHIPPSREPDKRARRKRERKIKCIKYLGSECRHCHTTYNGKNGAIYEFHHFQGKKKAQISDLIADEATDKRLYAELQKCELLCGNCHELHHGPRF